MNERFPVIVGPTAGGKSALGVEVCLRGGGEFVSADSMQVYRGLDIGSAKPTEAERRGVPHHLVDVAEPTERFTVADWLGLADRAVAEIRGARGGARGGAGGGVGGMPVVVGGTNLYIKAFLEGMFDAPEPSPEIVASVRGMTQAERRAELERVDPSAVQRIHPNDERRTCRALEVYRQTGTPISELQRQWDRERRLRPEAEGAVLVGLDWPAELINRRINARVREMMERGLLEETRGLWEAGRLGPQAREALGYKQLLAHLEGRWSLAEAVEQIKIETRRFAKNQRTWLRRLRTTPGSVWIPMSDGVDVGELAERVLERLRD